MKNTDAQAAVIHSDTMTHKQVAMELYANITTTYYTNTVTLRSYIKSYPIIQV